MEVKDWYDCGARIGDLVQRAIDTGDFGSLSQGITDIVGDTLSAIGEQAGLHGEAPKTRKHYRGGSEYRSSESAFRAAQRRAEEAGRRLYSDGTQIKAPRGLKGLISMILGYSMAGTTGMGTIVMAALALFTGLGLFRFMAFMLLIMTVVFTVIGMKGGTSRDRERRAERYMRLIGDRDLCTIDELAAATGRSREYVLKDVKVLMQEGLFRSGVYMDDEETTLMTSPEVYRQYRETKQAYEEKKRQSAQAAERRRAAEADLSVHSEETKKILEEGREFIAHIHEANEKIPDEELTEKLNTLENVVTRIFEQVAAKPDSAPDLHRMMTHYLTVTRKLVDAYVELDRQKVQVKNVVSTKQEINKSLDTINAAFEMILDSFFEDTAWDISTDISTLRTMMAHDGLTGQQDFGPGSHTASAAKDLTGDKSGKPSAGGKGAGGAGSAGAGAAAAAPMPDEE